MKPKSPKSKAKEMGRKLPVRRVEQVHKSPTDYDRRDNTKAIEESLEENMDITDVEIEKRLDTVEAVLKDYRAGTLTAFSTLIIISMIINPQEVSEEGLAWGRDVVARLEKEDGEARSE